MDRYKGAKLSITRKLGYLTGLTCKKYKYKQRSGLTWCRKKKLTQDAIR